MRNVPANGPTVPGYDVSRWQPDIHIHAQQAALGKKFCLIKCDESGAHDVMFKRHWLEAKKQGMIVGAYNFFHPAQDPKAQAQDLINLVGQLGPGDLGAICDNEKDDGLPARDADAAYTFMATAADALKKRSWYYGSPRFTDDHIKGDARFSEFHNWVAQYPWRSGGPLVAPPWTTWNMWQFSGTGLDLNLFNGDLALLQTLAK